ncbi:hypothetical protein EXS45_02105 [Candidatus Nomurabacteria bacterium]|nr:hypothetical protein [Candidatus Nomurabacteria bacterium]
MTKILQEKNKLKELQYIPTYDDPDVYWATFDLGCSSALISAGFELVSLEKSNPSKVQFIFLKNNNIEKVVADYWANRLEVKARTFFDNTKMIKNRLYSE